MMQIQAKAQLMSRSVHKSNSNYCPDKGSKGTQAAEVSRAPGNGALQGGPARRYGEKRGKHECQEVRK
jgi:hypothetical protein